MGRQVVNVPSFLVRVDSDKHINFSLNSPLGQVRLPSYLILVSLSQTCGLPITNLSTLIFYNGIRRLYKPFLYLMFGTCFRGHAITLTIVNSNLTSLALCVSCVVQQGRKGRVARRRAAQRAAAAGGGGGDGGDESDE